MQNILQVGITRNGLVHPPMAELVSIEMAHCVAKAECTSLSVLTNLPGANGKHSH